MLFNNILKRLFIFSVFILLSEANVFSQGVDTLKSTFRIWEGNDCEGCVGRYMFHPDSFNISNPTAVLPDLSRMNYSWTGILNDGLNSFTKEHRIYGHLKPDYSIFSLGNYSCIHQDDVHQRNEKKETKSKILQFLNSKIFKSNIILEALYTWASPYYKYLFSQMSYEEQAMYLNELAGVKSYLDTFDYEKQLALLKHDPENFADSIGRSEAFCFRRINNKQLTPEECRQ